MDCKQVVVLSCDQATFPLVRFNVSNPQKKYQLFCCSYAEDGRTVQMKRFKGNEQELGAAINSKECCPVFESGNFLLALEKEVLQYNFNKRDLIIVLDLRNCDSPLGEEFCTLVSAQHSKEKNYADWLINKILSTTANTLCEISWQQIYDWLAQINNDNPCTAIIMDGEHIVFFQGSDFANSLYYVRSCPPHKKDGYFDAVQMNFRLNALDLNHSLFLMSTSSLPIEKSKFLNLQQMLVVKNGDIIWNNDPNIFWEQHLKNNLNLEVTQHQQYVQKIRLISLPVRGKNKRKKSCVTIPTESFDNEPRIYSLSHDSVYEYDEPVYLSKHLLRLQPVNDFLQNLLHYEMKILADGEPVKAIPNNFIGAFGNYASFIEIEQPYKRLEIISKAIITVSGLPPRRFDLLHNQRNIPLIWMPWDRIMMQAYLVPPELPESELRELSDYALSFVKRNNNDVFAVLNDINHTIFQDFTYKSGSTSLATTPYQVYVNHSGVCQDFANLFICLARLLNIPARYRTGYIYTAKDYKNHEQGDASHAWLEVFLPYIGWLGYDPTNYCLAEKNHIRVACGRTFSDATPTAGTIFRGGGKESLKINVQVLQLDGIDEDDLK